MIARLTRVIAVAIAIAAVVDPAWTATTRGRGIVGIVEPEGSDVGDRLAHDYRVVRGDVSAVVGTAVLVVVGRTYPSESIPPTARVATVTLPAVPSHVRLAAVDAPTAVPDATRMHLDVVAVAGPPLPAQTTLTARIGGVVVGRAQHAWSGSDDRWHAGLDVVPIGEPPWVVSVAVEGCASGASVAQAFKPAADAALKGCATSVVVDRRSRLAVTFFEPRPSWATTFARRALERDARFAVEAVTHLGDVEASAVVVGGLDRVTEADVAALDRFVRDRGGAVIVVPDEPIAAAAPARRLLAAREDEREVLLDRAVPLAVQAPLPRLAASEMITFASVGAETDVLARTADARPVVWAARRGEGRVLVSGALDAWRFRAADDAAFDRFWRAVAGGAALATPPLVDVRVSPAVVRPRDTVYVSARVHRSLAGDALAVSAALDSGEVVRLWPDAEIGVFSGTFTAPARDTTSRVEVTATSKATQTTGSAPFVVSGFSRTSEIRLKTDTTGAPELALLSASHRGIDVVPGDLSPLDRWLRATVIAPAVRAVRHPMRSPWWVVPFVACLSIDWWITSSRRRRR